MKDNYSKDLEDKLQKHFDATKNKLEGEGKTYTKYDILRQIHNDEDIDETLKTLKPKPVSGSGSGKTRSKNQDQVKNQDRKKPDQIR